MLSPKSSNMYWPINMSLLKSSNMHWLHHYVTKFICFTIHIEIHIVLSKVWYLHFPMYLRDCFIRLTHEIRVFDFRKFCGTFFSGYLMEYSPSRFKFVVVQIRSVARILRALTDKVIVTCCKWLSLKMSFYNVVLSVVVKGILLKSLKTIVIFLTLSIQHIEIFF